MPIAAQRHLATALLCMMALALAACSTVRSPRAWTETAQLAGGGSYTIAIRDESGRVDDVQVDPIGVKPPLEGVVNPPGQPNVVLVQWTGGACDARTDIDIAGRGQGLAITVRTTRAPGDCDAIGVGHVLQLTSAEPLPAAVSQVTTEP